MPGLSRRKLVVGALAAPVGVALAGTWAGATQPSASARGVRHLNWSTGPTHPASPDHSSLDPVMARASEWIAACELAAAMEAEWRGLETRLFGRAALLKMDCSLACRSGLGEARAMRALDRRIEAAYRKMRRVAGEAAAQPAVSMAGALAKIELGVRVQGEFDWREHALELIKGGVEEVRRLAG
jgi:hypothetical protein